MAKRVVYFSRWYPAYHHRAGEKTNFIEMLWNWYFKQPDCKFSNVEKLLYELNGFNLSTKETANFLCTLDLDLKAVKSHTIRAGHRFNKWDVVVPCTWMLPGGMWTKGNQMIKILPDIPLYNLWKFEIKDRNIYLNDKIHTGPTEHIASYDGLSLVDFSGWFKWPKPFDGQIICWDKEVQY